MQKEKISVCVDKELWQRYQEYCKSQGFSFSGRIELLIRRELEMSTKKEKKHQEIITILAEMINEKSMEKELEMKTQESRGQKMSMASEQINKLNITT
ncbi:MAG: hypothetical protein V1743_03695 [Nanoarchaeota archaeon]